MPIQSSTIPESETIVRSFEATETGARNGVGAVMQDLATLIPAGSKLEDIQISLVEAVNNIVEHSYAGLASGQITVAVRVSGSSLNIEIDDEGAPFPTGKPPAGVLPVVSGPLAALPEGGFGWFLIRRLANRVQYDRKQGRNRLNMRFAFEADPDEGASR